MASWLAMGGWTAVHGQADLHEELEAVRASYHWPGVSAMVARKGEIVALGAAGVRREGTAPLLRV